jgi:hypothetical protein
VGAWARGERDTLGGLLDLASDVLIILVEAKGHRDRAAPNRHRGDLPQVVIGMAVTREGLHPTKTPATPTEWRTTSSVTAPPA